MSAKETFSQVLRYVLFALSIAGEFTLAVFFLVFKYHDFFSDAVYYGYTIFFGWSLAITSIVIGVGLILFLLYAFILPDDRKKGFLSDNKNVRNLGLLSVFVVFIQIILIALTLFFYSPLARNVAYAYLLIILVSLMPPIILYYVANFDPESDKLFSLSKDTPLRIKATTVWLLFLTGVIQIFATEWTFLVVGLFILLASYFLYFLTRYAIALTPMVLIIHIAFSALMAGIALYDLDNLIANLPIAISKLHAILFAVFVLLVPAAISVVLTQSLFRKWLLEWAREIQPVEEMEIERYYEEDGDDYLDEDELDEVPSEEDED